jgi:hypothetical protein
MNTAGEITDHMKKALAMTLYNKDNAFFPPSIVFY